MSSKALRLSICLLFLSFVSLVAKATQPSDFGCDGSTLEIGSCLGGIYEKADKELNAAYQKLIGHHATWVADLRAAESKWIEFRDLNCNFYGNYLKGGSGAGPYYLACKVRMTEERVMELRKLQQPSSSCETKQNAVRTQPKWIKLDRENQGETATEICRRNGFKIAAKAKRCGGGEYELDDPSYITRDANSNEEKTYADRFKFYTCEMAPKSGGTLDGVVWDSILCQSVENALEPSDCVCIANTTEQHKCVGKLLGDADKELNTTYQSLVRLVRNHGEDWVKDLRAAQRKWIEFRDHNCEFYSDYSEDVAGAGPYLNACKIRLTRERATELKRKQQLLIERGYAEVNK